MVERRAVVIAPNIRRAHIEAANRGFQNPIIGRWDKEVYSFQGILPDCVERIVLIGLAYSVRTLCNPFDLSGMATLVQTLEQVSFYQNMGVEVEVII